MSVSSAGLESRLSASSSYSCPAAKEQPRGPTNMIRLLLRMALLNDSVVLGEQGSPDLSSWKAASQQPCACKGFVFEVTVVLISIQPRE